MLVGRSQECEIIDRLLGDVTQGRSGALVLRGGTGVGKSALLHYAASRGVDFLHLTATAVESETAFGYAGLQQLLAPVLDLLDRIPPVQAEALRGALVLSDPVSAGRMYVGAASLSLMSAAGGEQPVLCLVDDAQWMDSASAEALVFAARRLSAESIAMVFAANEEVGPFAAEGLSDVRIEGLGDDDAATLLRSGAPAITDDVVRDVVTATGGNPLALVQMPSLLTADQIAGRDPLPYPLPVGTRLSELYAARAAGLSSGARTALVMAAASETGGMRVLAPEELDADALLEAESAGLISIDAGRVRFAHPLVRSAVYRATPAADRRQAHRRLADLYASQPGSLERRAWHLAAAATGPDDDVANEIADAGSAAAERRAHVQAAALFERAAALTSDPGARARWLVEAAWSSRLAGRSDRASELVRLAMGDAASPATRARGRCLLGLVALDAGTEASADEMIADATAVEEEDPGLAARLLTIGSEVAREPDRALELASRARALAQAGTASQVFSTVAFGRASARGGHVDDATIATAEAAQLLRTYPELGEDPEVLLAVVDGLADVGADLASTEEMMTLATSAARDHTVIVLPRGLSHRSRLEHRRGDWRDALVHGYEAARLFHETGQAARARTADAWLGFIEALLGHESAAGELASSLRSGGVAAGAPAADRIEGSLALALGRPERAAPLLRAWLNGPAEGALLPVDPQGAADAVESSIHAGDLDEASAIASTTRDDHPDSELCAAWIDALVAEGDAAHASFERALAIADATDRVPPFLRARVRLSAGERIRRDGEARAARPRLHEALDAFTSMGATPWAERAARELRASGERVERVGGSSLDELTPQELQIARVIAEGATYKEAAARMYLSPKTIEYHLGKVYRKLGLRTGKELAGLFAREDYSP